MTISSFEPRRFDCGFIVVRLVWRSKRRVPKSGMVGAEHVGELDDFAGADELPRAEHGRGPM